MAQTLEQIAVDIQTKLGTIQTNTGNTEANVLLVKADTSAMLNRINFLIGVNQTGFSSLSQGIAEMIKQQAATNQQLLHNNLQNEVIICWLKIMANLLCDILRELQSAGMKQEQAWKCLCTIKEILELVHGTEAIEVRRLQELKKQVEECCPPPRPEPKPCFSGCQDLREPPRNPDPGYKPLDPREPPKDQPTPNPVG